MAKKTCSRCGMKYSGFFSRCPQCSYEEGTPLSNEDIEKYKATTTQSEMNDNSNIPKVKMSRWYFFATGIMVIESIAVFILLVLNIASEDADWNLFLLVFGAYLFELAFLAIIQLLAGIKFDIDKLLNQRDVTL